MQTVSDKWKQNQQQDFTSEGYLDIVMQVTDPEVFRVGSVTTNSEADISMTNTVLGMDSYDVKPYTTLEPYVWKLDGTRIGLPDTGELFTGYVSEVTCNRVGNFTTQPVITISFSETITHTVPGITLIFSEVYDSYATSFLLEVSNNGSVIYSLDETANDKATVIIDQDFVNFDEVSLTIRKWLKPYERARVAALLMGFTEQFTKTDIFKYQNTQYIGLVSDKLPKLEITFDVDNTSGRFNPLNPDGITAYLMNKQEISVKYGFKLNNNVEYITGGTYFLSEWSAPQNGLKATFRARDILEYFNNTYMKGRYVPAGQTLYDMAMDIFTEANLPLNRDGTSRYHVDNSLQTIKTKAPLPLQSMAVCLQLIANAGKCIIRPTRDGQIYIEPLNIDLSDYEINNFNSYKKAEIETIKQVKDIKVKIYNYYAGDSGQELSNGDVYIDGTEDVWITYSSPAISNTVSASVSGGTLNSATYYSNACLLNITGTGSVTVSITGQVLQKAEVDVTMPNAGIDKGETETVTNQLITSAAMATAVGQWVLDYENMRKYLKFDWRIDPRIDIADTILYSNEDVLNGPVLMKEINMTYGGAFTGNGKGVLIE